MSDATHRRLIELLRGYRSSGYIKAGELLLPPGDAMRLAQDLARIGVPISGVDGWRLVPAGIVQDITIDYSIDETILNSDAAALRSAERAVEFIRQDVPEDVKYVSFTLDVPNWWNLFPDDSDEALSL